MWKTDRGAREGASIEDSGGGAAQNGDKRGGYFGSDLQRPVWQEMGLAAKAVKQGLLKEQLGHVDGFTQYPWYLRGT